MARFSDSFWSQDYQTGVKAIFGKLRQGIAENNEVLNMIATRVSLETTYAGGLEAFPVKLAPTSSGFDRDEGASLRHAYTSYLDELANQGRIHAAIAVDLDRNVRSRLQAWCEGHKSRVLDAEATLLAKIKAYEKVAAHTHKLQQAYYAKCRQLDDLEGSVSVPAKAPAPAAAASAALARGLTMFRQRVPSAPMQKPKHAPTTPGSSPVRGGASTPSDTASTPEKIRQGRIVVGNVVFSEEQVKQIVTDMLEQVTISDYKIPIIGTYPGVSNGEEIVLYIRTNLSLKSVASAERFGQGLVDAGYLKAVGQVTSRFVNSISSHYQWQPKARGEDETEAQDDEGEVQDGAEQQRTDKSQEAGPLSPTKRTHAKTQSVPSAPAPTDMASKLRAEIEEADERYRAQVAELDYARADVERSIEATLTFMEKCELDRLRAIKTALSDFNKRVARPSATAASLERQDAYQASIAPESDLRYMVEQYRTGPFAPKVVTYQSFKASGPPLQSFGVDVEQVPFVVPLFVEYFKGVEGLDPAVFHSQVRLPHVHQLRAQINTGAPFDAKAVFSFFKVEVVASTFKEWLLELPDSLVSFTVYDIVRAVYEKESSTKQEGVDPEDGAAANKDKDHIDGTDENKNTDHVAALASALSQVSRPSYDALQQTIEFFSDLCGSDADRPEKIDKLSRATAMYLFRPRTVTAQTAAEAFPSQFVADLISQWAAIHAAVQARKTSAQSQGPSGIKSPVTSSADRRALLAAKRSELEAALRPSAEPPHRAETGSPNGSPYLRSRELRPLALSPRQPPVGGDRRPASPQLTASRDRSNSNLSTGSNGTLPIALHHTMPKRASGISINFETPRSPSSEHSESSAKAAFGDGLSSSVKDKVLPPPPPRIVSSDEPAKRDENTPADEPALTAPAEISHHPASLDSPAEKPALAAEPPTEAADSITHSFLDAYESETSVTNN